jgi:hypothetical protein
VLVTAGRHGGRVQIGVTDDGAPADRLAIEGQLREVSETCALQGATLEVQTFQPGGAAVLIRLPDSTQGRSAPHVANSKAEPPQAPAKRDTQARDPAIPAG